MGMLSPQEIAEKCCDVGTAKGKMPWGKTIPLSILAGAYISFAAVAATAIGSGWPEPWASSGLNSAFFGASFALGLILVVLAGSELFTGNIMYLSLGVLDGKTPFSRLILNWSAVFVLNFVGAMILLAVIFGGGLPLSGDGLSAYGLKATAVALKKLSFSPVEAFCRGIGCNWLVCLAIWMANGAKDASGKILAIFFPIFTFVMVGFEHSIANMFFIPSGLVLSVLRPEAVAAVVGDSMDLFTWGHFLLGNLLPVTLGNIVGGGLFVACIYWYSYLKK